MSNFSVNYLPSSNAILGLQNSGVLTVFNEGNINTFQGPTGITGITGSAGPNGSSSVLASTGITGAILYSNGSGGIGSTGGLLWNLGSQTLTTNTILSNTFSLNSFGNIYPLSATFYTNGLGADLSPNVLTNGYSATITSPNFGNSWGIRCNYFIRYSVNSLITFEITSYVQINSSVFASSTTVITPNLGTAKVAIFGNGFCNIGIAPNTSTSINLFSITASSLTVSSFTGAPKYFSYEWYPIS